MPVHNELGKRIKEYEKANTRYLTRRMPVMCRLDGCNFHSFTRNFHKPFDKILIQSMQDTMQYLCENVQGAKIAYHQSDEITLLLVDYEKLNQSAFFDNRQNKIESVLASMATMAFNKAFEKNIGEWVREQPLFKLFNEVNNDKIYKLYQAYLKSSKHGAIFDCMAFNVPKEDVTNAFYWRQVDAIRNSVQMLGQANFSSKELDHKNQRMIKEMLFEKHIYWDELPTHLQRGSCCIKEEYYIDNANKKEISKKDIVHSDEYSIRTRWVIDKEIPIFKDNGRSYIDNLVECRV